ncbi:hypothetical protein PRIC1_005049 [Phytophthora ramorum]
MAALAHSTLPSLSPVPRPYSMQKMERRPPIHHASRDSFGRASIGDNQDVYIGEGLIDPNGMDDLDEDAPHKSHHHDRKHLDYLAIDIGEKYLDDMYKEDDTDDDNTDGEEGGFLSDGPPTSSSYHSMQRAAVVKPAEVDSVLLEQIEEEEQAERHRVEKDVAWQKVRQLLIEEEEKAAGRKKTRTSSGNGEDYGTVKLLDSLTRTGSDGAHCNSSGYSDATPRANNTRLVPHPRDPPQTFARHIGSRLTHFLHGGPASVHGSAGSHSWRSQSSSSSSDLSQSTLLATLDEVTKVCQRSELSELSIAQIASHLTSIDQIVREDIANHHKRGSRRLSSTQNTYDSNGYDIEYRVPTYPSDRRANVAPTVRNSFKAFTAAQDLCDTLAAFNNLVRDCGLNGVKVEEPWYVYYHVRAAVYSKLGYRQKHLFKLLDARLDLDVYKQRPAANKRVCIVGAGPVGLRAAIELALLGSHVSVLEKRTKFSRENMLHLWPWVVQDLATLGAKVLFSKFCRSRTYFHVSTRQLQVVLLKVALLIGVKVYSATGFESIVPPQVEETGGKPFYSVKTEPQIPIAEFTAVLGATGTNNQLAEPAGINRFVFSNKESLGIVCYFPNLETAEETKVKEFSWTSQLKHHMLHKMREVGIDLENIVYFRGEMHYMVMTPKRHNLLARGVVKRNYESPGDLVRDTNINQSVLHSFVRRIVEFVGIPRKTDFTRVSLFDFSSLTRAEKAASVLTSHGKKLYVGLIGDSLLEPVWHEGVGTCRGFLSALDGVWMVAQIGRTPDEQILADREIAYRVMQRLSGHHRDEMQKNVRKYTVDPKSRYMVHFPQIV